jgi:hypothetical protein
MSKKNESLRNLRLRANLSLREVAACFKSGVSAERIRQIEITRAIRPETKTAFEHAVQKALSDRRKNIEVYGPAVQRIAKTLIRLLSAPGAGAASDEENNIGAAASPDQNFENLKKTGVGR